MIVEVVMLLIVILIFVGIAYMAIGDLLGAPYVPTPEKLAKEVLAQIGLKQGQEFIDVGSGDGRIVIQAIQDYGVKGTGIEIQPYLLWWSRWRAKQAGVKAKFRRENYWKSDFSRYDVIYFYLFPQTVQKLAGIIDSQCKKGTRVVSRAFLIKGWEKKLTKTINVDGKLSYVYQV